MIVEIRYAAVFLFVFFLTYPSTNADVKHSNGELSEMTVVNLRHIKSRQDCLPVFLKGLITILRVDDPMIVNKCIKPGNKC